ncbi:MAG: hypothetical protein IBX44_10065 [Sulfurospirillum sp.]|nr:hypothetical protein [Sulfurospirillum sp.]
MLVLARFTLFFIMLGSLLVYLFTNIKLIGEGSQALAVLALSAVIGVFLIVLELVLKQKVYIKKSFLLLILFFIYFIVNATLNRPDDLKSLLIATSGGIVLFYILGSLVSTNLLYIKEKVLNSKQFLNIFNFLYFVFSIIFMILLIDTFITLMANVREDLFLIADLDGMYQRAGAFLVISFFIYSFITVFFLFVNKYVKKKKASKLMTFVLFILYCFISITGMLLSQMIGSNNTLVNLGGLLFATTIFYIFINFTKPDRLLSYMKLNFRKIFLSKLTKKLFGSIFVSLFILLILLIGLINVLDIDLDKFRILGFGSGEVSSISARLELWNNFTTQFNYNPIFGNMAVDALTTGDGSYVHSFIASLLTHLGIVGFVLFFVYLFIAIKERFNHLNELYVNNLFSLYSLVVFCGIFAIASFGTFITWIPIWFLLGLIFPPIVFKNEKELNFEKSNINSIKQF